MKKHRKTKRRLPEKIVKKLDIPEDIIFDIPRITIMANKEMRIENYNSILEYENNKIVLSANSHLIQNKNQFFSLF